MTSRKFDNLHVELLTHFQKNHSMLWLSRRLGYRHNQVYLWKNNRREFYWKDFENLCDRFNLPLKEKIRVYYLPSGETGFASLVAHQIKGKIKTEIRVRYSLSPSKLSRWSTGKASPPFDLACEIFDFASICFLEFLNSVLGASSSPTIQKELKRRNQIKQALYRAEYIGALAPAVELKSYRSLKKHKPGFLAEKIGISIQEEEYGLKVLEDAGVLYFADGIYKLKSYRLYTGDSRDDFLKIIDYWSKRAAKINKQESVKSFFGYRVFGITSEGLQKLKMAQVNYYSEISQVLQGEPDDFDHIVAIPFQTLVLDEK